MTLADGVLTWHINGQRAAEVRGVPSGVHFGVGRFDGTVEVRIQRALVAGAVRCRARIGCEYSHLELVPISEPPQGTITCTPSVGAC
jgi:hypothetical protein